MLEKRKVIILGSVIGIAMIIMAIIGITQQSSKTSQTRKTYTDSASGEQIKDVTTSNQGTDISLKNAIIYPGFSQLISRGLSPEQVQSIESTILEYSLGHDKGFKEVSLYSDSVRHILPQGTSQTHTLTFTIKVNRTDDYSVSVSYSDTLSCVTKLLTADKKTLLIER
jgi:hypothetical protein